MPYRIYWIILVLLCIGVSLVAAQTAPTAQEAPVLRLTNDPAFDVRPAWSPDGQTIAFISNRGKHTTFGDVWAVNPDGTNVHPLTASPDFNEFGLATVAWLGSTGDLVVLDTEVNWEYFRVRLSAASSTPIVRTVVDGDSPFFERVLFIPGGLGSNSFAVTRDANTAAWTMLTTPWFTCPWHSDFRIAPFSVLNGDSGTVLGAPLLQEFSNCASSAAESFRGIAFSPDGSEIVVSRNIDPNLSGFDLEIYTSSGIFVRRLTFNGTDSANPVVNYNPAWSSDNRIAFASNSTGRFEIYTINPDGSNLKPITTNGGDWPSWSPDSSKIAFQSTRSGNSEIYTIPAQNSFEFPIFTGRSTEPSIAVDPLNVMHAVVGFNDESKVVNGCGWSESYNRGVSWSPGSRLLLPTGFTLANDPSVRYSADGKLYYACLAVTPYSNPQGFAHTRTVGVVVAVSNTGAATDLQTAQLVISTEQVCIGIDGLCSNQGEFTDRPALAIAQRTDGGSRIIVCWTDFFHFNMGKDNSFVNISFSDDGRSWSKPNVLAKRSEACTIGAYGADVAVADFNFAGDELRVRMSEDSGSTWNPELALNSAGPLIQGSTMSSILSVPYALVVPASGDFRSVWQKTNPNSQVFLGSATSDSQGVLFRDPEIEKILVSPEKFLPGASASCPQLAGAYETTTATWEFRYKVWPLNGLVPIKPLFTSSFDLDSAFGDLDNDHPGFRRIGDYTSVDCSGQIGWAAWTDLRNGKPEIWGAIIPIP